MAKEQERMPNADNAPLTDESLGEVSGGAEPAYCGKCGKYYGNGSGVAPYHPMPFPCP